MHAHVISCKIVHFSLMYPSITFSFVEMAGYCILVQCVIFGSIYVANTVDSSSEAFAMKSQTFVHLFSDGKTKKNSQSACVLPMDKITATQRTHS